VGNATGAGLLLGLQHRRAVVSSPVHVQTKEWEESRGAAGTGRVTAGMGASITRPRRSGEEMGAVEVRGLLPSVGELRWHSQAQKMRRLRPRRADRADDSGRMLKSRPPSLG
jgi:hypothetical protein